jgi:Cu(I)/Ag(I) efflux system membrane fusion protein
VEVDNPDRLLRRNLYAHATVALEAPEVLTIPRTAVLWPGQNPRAYLEKSAGAYQYCALKLGRAGDDSWEVLAGLHEGERVVTSGNMLIDGQAQLNNNMTVPVDAPAAPLASEAAKSYLNAVAVVTEALASDNLPAYLAAVKKLPPAPSELPVKTHLSSGAADLMAARKAFLPFSQEVSALALPFAGKWPELKVFHCPMTDELWAGAPKNAKWVQLAAEVRNPYWGKQMLDCGAEVK